MNMNLKTSISLIITLSVIATSAQDSTTKKSVRCYGMLKQACLNAIKSNASTSEIELKCTVPSELNTFLCPADYHWCLYIYKSTWNHEEEELLSNYTMKPWMNNGLCSRQDDNFAAVKSNKHLRCDGSNGLCFPDFSIDELLASLTTRQTTTRQTTTAPTTRQPATPVFSDDLISAVSGMIDDGNPKKVKLIAICVSLVIVMAVIIAVIALFLSRRLKTGTDSEAAINSCSSDETINKHSDTEKDFMDAPDVQYENLPLIGKGRYSQLLKLGQYEGHECVLKMTEKSEHNSWLREKMMFNIPGIEHENIVRCFGSFLAPLHHREMCVLVLEYHKLGSVHDYLKNHSLTWNEVIHICHTMAAGVSHLHEVTTVNNNIKYPIAHRDLKSENILLTIDLSAVITDFNLAYSLEEQDLRHDTTAALNMAGTWRYLAPEMLDTAITRDNLSGSLLAADVYSLGLIMWEVLTLWQNSQEKPVYVLPYADHFKCNPTREALRELVFDRRIRPDIPARLLKEQNNNPDVSELISTIQSSWDNDPESRLTASCIKVRLEEIECPPTTFSRVGSFFSGISLRNIQNAITRRSIRQKKLKGLSIDIVASV